MLCPDYNNYQTMPDKFQDKYRIPSARLKNWNYGQNAAYFVTICTQNRISWFGEMQMGTDALPCVSLSSIGKIVQTEWIKTFEMRPDMNLQMGEYANIKNNPANWWDDKFFDNN